MTSLVKAKFIVAPASLQSLSYVLKFPYDKNFSKVVLFDPNRLFMFSPIEAPPDFAEVLKAGLFECAENVLVSIPV